MQHKLQIEFIHQDRNILSKLTKKDLIQTRPFKIGFSFKNVGDNPILGITVSKIKYGSSDGQNIFAEFEKSFHLDTLNPNEEKRIWVDRVGTYMYGLCNVSLQLTPDTPNVSINTFQKDPFTNIWSPLVTPNHWSDFFFIRSKNEYEQSNVNSYLTFLTSISLAVSFIGIYLTYTSQILPEKYKQEAFKEQAREFCASHTDGSWPKAYGGMYTCKEIMQMLGTTTPANK